MGPPPVGHGRATTRRGAERDASVRRDPRTRPGSPCDFATRDLQTGASLARAPRAEAAPAASSAEHSWRGASPTPWDPGRVLGRLRALGWEGLARWSDGRGREVTAGSAVQPEVVRKALVLDRVRRGSAMRMRPRSRAETREGGRSRRQAYERSRKLGGRKLARFPGSRHAGPTADVPGACVGADQPRAAEVPSELAVVELLGTGSRLVRSHRPQIGARSSRAARRVELDESGARDLAAARDGDARTIVAVDRTESRWRSRGPGSRIPASQLPTRRR